MALTGFLDQPRTENPFRTEACRLADFEDLHTPLNVEGRHLQASRCMNCGVPFCQSDYGCPLHNLIPEWNRLLETGHERAALDRLLQTAPFPEFTGYVCPALCEKACNLADNGVTNRDNERYLIETGYANGWIQPFIPEQRNGKTAAVIGSGPSGLAAADLLNRLGCSVTVIERADRPGGLLMYGIPNMKLPKSIIMRRIDLMQRSGISFMLNTEATPYCLSSYDVVLLCGGARTPRRLNLEGEDIPGVHYAVPYLSEITRAYLDAHPASIDACGKNVIVVGGGDTGNDCVGTVLRQGAASVIQLEMMPAPPETRQASNPWPEWPRTLRTDYGQLEAISRQDADPRIYETTIQRIIQSASGQLEAVETVTVHRGPDGRFKPVPGTEQRRPCDLLLIAAGFTGCECSTANTFSLTPDGRGNLTGPDKSHFIRGNLFTAGDMHTGQSLVVRAIADGRTAALAAYEFLKSAQNA